MSKAALLEFADRAEKASGPDRELDLTIYLVLYPKSDIARMTKYRRGLDDEDGYSWEIVQGSVCFHRMDNGRCPFNGGYPLPACTSSLDAAMNLVPESYAWCVNHRRETQPSIRPNAQCWTKADRSTVHGDAATPALALTAAALRARAQQESKDA